MIYSTKETMPEDGQRVALVHKDSLISAIFKSGSFYTLYGERQTSFWTPLPSGEIEITSVLYDSLVEDCKEIEAFLLIDITGKMAGKILVDTRNELVYRVNGLGISSYRLPIGYTSLVSNLGNGKDICKEYFEYIETGVDEWKQFGEFSLMTECEFVEWVKGKRRAFLQGEIEIQLENIEYIDQLIRGW